MDNNIDAAIEWLSGSDVINMDTDDLGFGGIRNGYNWKNKKYQFVYSEITGYAINTFLDLYRCMGEEKYLRLAKNAADYLIKLQAIEENRFEYGAVAHSLTLPDGEQVKNYWSFDNAIILHGMSNLAKTVDEKKYNDASLAIGDWLLKMQKEDGPFYSCYNAETKALDYEGDRFEFDDGCLHIKNAIGLMTLHQISDNQKYYNAGLKICNWGERLLERDGVFWANPRRKYVFTHAHCYATEGYLYAYYFSKETKFLNIAKKAGEALIQLQNRDGSLYRIYKNKLSIKEWKKEKLRPWKTADATSQAVRIWTLLYSIHHEEKFLKSARKGIEFLRTMQVSGVEDQNMNGGLYYQRCDSFGKKRISSVMFTWCTQFGLSAFILYKATQDKVTFDDLVQRLY